MGTVTPFDIDCGRARRLLLAGRSGPEALTPEHRALERHLHRCSACRSFLDEQHEWRRLGRRLAGRDRAPPAARRRLFRTLALARAGLTQTPPRRRRPLAFAAPGVAAAVAAVGLAWYWQAPDTARNNTSEEIAEDHWRELHRAAINSGDPDTVHRWLAERLSIPVHVMDFEDASLEGARLCFVNRRAGAVMIYRVDDEPVSYFVMPAENPAQRRAEAEALQNHADQGYNVIAWEARGLQHALVSALPAERLRPMRMPAATIRTPAGKKRRNRHEARGDPAAIPGTTAAGRATPTASEFIHRNCNAVKGECPMNNKPSPSRRWRSNRLIITGAAGLAIAVAASLATVAHKEPAGRHNTTRADEADQQPAGDRPADTDAGLPGAPPFSDRLLTRFEQKRARLDDDYEPRTRHLNPDGSARYTNRLFLESSPYLLQHAHNPVNWYPWGEEAFERAEELNRPILLSIGYSTCHWCHVMEEESFENPEIARFLNKHYVAIKVDREERPDIDSIYMNAVQAIAGRGGWPMTVWLTPDKLPFMGGTYFPPDRFLSLLEKMKNQYENNPNEIRQRAQETASKINRKMEGTGRGSSFPDAEQAMTGAFRMLKRGFDDTHGGWGRGNKFPMPRRLQFLLR
jgi:hypothetical protein